MQTIYVFRVDSDIVSNDEYSTYCYMHEHDNGMELKASSTLEALAKELRKFIDKLRQTGINTGIRFKAKYDILNIEHFPLLHCYKFTSEEQNRFRKTFHKN